MIHNYGSWVVSTFVSHGQGGPADSRPTGNWPNAPDLIWVEPCRWFLLCVPPVVGGITCLASWTSNNKNHSGADRRKLTIDHLMIIMLTFQMRAVREVSREDLVSGI